jgi:hypothetical protein
LPFPAVSRRPRKTGAINGTVVDLSGKPISNAEIQATNSTTSAVFKAMTSPAGAFAFEALPAGSYRLSSAPAGFNAFTQQGIIVGSGNTLRLNLRFEDFQLNTLEATAVSFLRAATLRG